MRHLVFNLCFLLSALSGTIHAETAETDALRLFDAGATILKDTAPQLQKPLAEQRKTLSKAPSKPAAPQGTSGRQETASSETAARQYLNEAIRTLPHAHGRVLDASEQAYWALSSAFSGDLGGAKLRHIGALFAPKGKRWFISRVLEGSPAAAAGLAAGDEMIAVDDRPFEPVTSFWDPDGGAKPKSKVNVTIRHLPWDQPRTIELETVLESLQESQLRAMQRGAHVYNIKGKQIGAIWLPMATHPDFYETLKRLASGMQSHTAAMVLDLRGGFGGGDLAYFDLFLGDTTKQSTAPVYRRPLVILIDERTSGGKELLAYILQKEGRATVIGQRSAGLAHAGQLHTLIPGRYALYYAPPPKTPLALEGQGVEPDIKIAPARIYAAGADEALNQALDAAAKLK